jgi:hypothetical protein
MSASRTLVTVLLVLASAGLAWGQSYPLAESVKADDCFRVRIEMTLSGEIKVLRDGKADKLPLTARATLEFPERVLSVTANGLPDKAARVYQTANATVGVAKQKGDKSLRKERQLVVAQRAKDQLLTYSPAGPLTREELELVGDHYDTLGLTGLLPGKDMAVGDAWKVPNAVALALGHLEALTDQDLTCKLEEVKDKIARVSVNGTINGIELGASAKLKIEANYQFDTEAKRLTKLEWKQTDERDQGPASPSLTSESTTTITRTAIDKPDSLTDAALISVPSDDKIPEALTCVDYRDPKGRFDMTYGRDWQVVGQTNERLIVRLMDRGDFVAQATITPWASAAKGKHMTEEEFKDAMNKSAGWEAEKELQVGEVPADDGKYIYRLSMIGKLDEISVMQNFYLVAGPNGEQVVIAVTLTPRKAEKLGSRDLSLAGSVDFLKK